MTLASAKPSTTNHPRCFTQSEAKGAARCSHFTADGRRCQRNNFGGMLKCAFSP